MKKSTAKTVATASPFRFDLSQGDASEPSRLLDNLAELFVRAVIERRA